MSTVSRFLTDLDLGITDTCVPHVGFILKQRCSSVELDRDGTAVGELSAYVFGIGMIMVMIEGKKKEKNEIAYE